MKAYENDRIVPIASARLRSAGTCERVAHDESRIRDAKVHPILNNGVMMSAQNLQAYTKAKQDEWRRSWTYRAQQHMEKLRNRKTVTPVTNIEE